MTKRSVKLSITIKVCEQQEEYEREIEIKELEESVRAVTEEIGQKVMKRGIEEVDEHIRKEIPESWQNLGTEKRTMISTAGWIQYRRHIYRDEQGVRRKPVDELLGLERYGRCSQQVEQMGAYLASESNYREAAERMSWLLRTDVSHSGIQRMVWKIGNQIADDRDAEREAVFNQGASIASGEIETQTLYGESDGVWLHLQREKKKSVEVRVATMYTGKEMIGKQRYKLKNKCSVVAVGLNSQAWQEELLKTAHQAYRLESVERLVTGGDGNSWVRRSYQRFGIPQEYLLDRFHLARAARGALRNRAQARATLEVIRTQGYAAVAPFLQARIEQADGNQQAQLVDFFNYLRHNQDSLLDLEHRPNGQKSGNLGAIEGNVDKLVVRRMKGRGRSWKLRGIRGMLAICQARTQLRQLAFQRSPKMLTKNHSLRRQRLSVTYVEKCQKSMPVFSGPHQSRPWVQSLRRYVHNQ